MVFLWVFGRAVEDRLGPFVYLPFYLLIGALAGLAQSYVVGPQDTAPLIGASGAIAGILGAYLVSYPKAWVTILLPVLFFFWAFDLPAVLVLAFWFVSQFFNGIAAITHSSQATDGVAVWAHVAGFVLGAATVRLIPVSGGPSVATHAPPMRRSNAPGPARLVSSVADLVALLLAARVVLALLGLNGPRSPFAGVVDSIYGVTRFVVMPFAELIPPMVIGGFVVETYTLAAIACVYLVAGLIGQLFMRR